jgi:hypothetical protein
LSTVQMRLGIAERIVCTVETVEKTWSPLCPVR